MRTGKLAISENRGLISVGGFDVYANFSLISKREPSMLTLAWDGTYATSMPCTKPKSPAYPLVNDIYYCNG